MPEEKRTFPEFEIVEQFHNVDALPPGGEDDVWQSVLKTADLLERRTSAAEAALGNLKEDNDAVRRKFLIGLIEGIMDNLDRIDATSDGAEGDQAAQRWTRRFRIIRRKMEDVLAREQVVPIDLVSAPPGLITIDATEERDDFPDGAVVSVNWKGYLWKGEILRKASVTVARNVSTTTNREEPDSESKGSELWRK